MATCSNISRVIAAAGFLLSFSAEGQSTKSSPEIGKPFRPEVTMGGVLMLDTSRFDGVYGDGSSDTETHLRRATIALETKLSPTLKLELSAGLEDGFDEAEIKDALLSWKIDRRQKLTIGQHKEPFGLENNQSSRQIPVIERSMASALFVPDRHIGASYSIRKSGISAAIGIFDADDDNHKGAGLAISSRVTAAVVRDDSRTLHIGGSVTRRDMAGASVKLKDEGSVNPAANIVSSKRYEVDSVQTVGLEAAWSHGALSFQGEWFHSGMQLAEDAPDPAYDGGYLRVAWLLGSASRRYDYGKFKISGLKRGPAWEAVIGAARADLRHDGDGTRARTLLAGINYYHDKQLRVMAGFLTARTSGPDVSDSPDGNAVTLRLQYAF